MYGFLFRFFSFFADKTGGNILFVKPKVLLGSLVLGLSSGTCSTVPTTANNVQPLSEKENDVESIIEMNKEDDLSCYIVVPPKKESGFLFNGNKVFSNVEQMPKFPGGDEAIMKFISENVNYPNVMCYEGGGPEGRVVLKFVVNEDGSVSDIAIVKSLDLLCDKEAIRVVSLMPKFIPGKQNGEVCKVWFYLPVSFRKQF